MKSLLSKSSYHFVCLCIICSVFIHAQGCDERNSRFCPAVYSIHPIHLTDSDTLEDLYGLKITFTNLRTGRIHFSRPLEPGRGDDPGPSYNLAIFDQKLDIGANEKVLIRATKEDSMWEGVMLYKGDARCSARPVEWLQEMTRKQGPER